MYSGKKDIFYKDFFDTFTFFWPFHYIQANLLIVLDDENPLDHEFEIELRQTFESKLSKEIKNNYFNYYITFEKPNGAIYNYSGYNRQQWSMFWCDKFLNKLNISNQYKWIGFVDTDTVFTSIITPQTIFYDYYNINNPKPITICNLGFSSLFHRKCFLNTPKWFGKKELFRHMDQFPATFKVSHIKNFREESVKYWLKSQHIHYSFDEIVQKLLGEPPFIHKMKADGKMRYGKYFSQFNIFAIYVWNYAQNEYEWYFEPANGNQWKQRKKMNHISKHKSLNEILNFSTPEFNIHNGEKESMVRIAIHESYIDTTPIQLIAKGYCFSTNWISQYCKQLNDILQLKNRLYDELFQFVYGIKLWSTNRFKNQSLYAQNAYYKKAQAILSNHHWYTHALIENVTLISEI